MPPDTGFPIQDAQDDFLRARRRRVFARLSAILRLEPGDIDVMLPFDEVVEALGRVGELVTRVPADRSISLDDLPLKSHERLFHERVPLPAQARGRLELTDPVQYGALAEGVEAWGLRLIQHDARFLTREEVALRWLQEEYEPVVAILREAELIGRRETETDAYMRL